MYVRDICLLLPPSLEAILPPGRDVMFLDYTCTIKGYYHPPRGNFAFLAGGMNLRVKNACTVMQVFGTQKLF